MFDALVLGAGPAGIALAAALRARGLGVAVVAPDAPVDAPPAWRPTYCAWQDELDAVGVGAHTDQRWPGAIGRFGAGADGAPRVHDLPRAYARVDKAALAAALYGQCAGVAWVRGSVGSVTHTDRGSTVTLHDGSTLEAAVVIDAGGHRPALLSVSASPAPALQTAVGRTLALARSPWPADRAGLMDFDPLPGDNDGPTTFLYVLPLADGRVFVEETCLAARPALPAAALTARLDRRLAAWGVSGASDEPEEWVSIPMGGALPHNPRVLGFGAAAGMIHPATGYLLPRVLGAAPRVADAVALALGAPGCAPAQAVAAGWEALWPRDRRQCRALYRFGLEALLAMDPATTRAFFHHFFTLPQPLWAAYLADGLTAAELRGVMLTLFGRVPVGLKWGLARAGFGAEGVSLARAMLGG